MKITVGDWFKLPFLGKDVFSSLRRAGVDYEKGKGFLLNEQTDIEQAVKIIEANTGEKVELYLRCFICSREACSGCEYFELCERESVSVKCLCSEHLSFSQYSEFFKNLTF